jgi:hypothetical protein
MATDRHLRGVAADLRTGVVVLVVVEVEVGEDTMVASIAKAAGGGDIVDVIEESEE